MIVSYNVKKAEKHLKDPHEVRKTGGPEKIETIPNICTNHFVLPCYEIWK